MNHKTVVAFSRARIWNASKIQMAIAKGLIQCPTLNVVPKATVSKVIKAALASRELGVDMKAFLAQIKTLIAHQVCRQKKPGAFSRTGFPFSQTNAYAGGVGGVGGVGEVPP